MTEANRASSSRDAESRNALEQRVRNLERELTACRAESEALRLQLEVEKSRSETSPRHTQLMDAIDALSDGLVIFDSDERLVLCNSQYKELQPLIADVLVPGADFQEINRIFAPHGLGHPPDATRGQHGAGAHYSIRWYLEQIIGLGGKCCSELPSGEF